MRSFASEAPAGVPEHTGRTICTRGWKLARYFFAGILWAIFAHHSAYVNPLNVGLSAL